MTTTTVSRTDLISLTSLSFIRPIQLAYNVSGTKPGTRLYAFFDGRNVDNHITPTGGTKGQAVFADSAGNATGVFDIPPMTFNTGEKELRFQDEEEYDAENIPGSTAGSASAIFTSAGLLRTLRETINNTTIVQRNVIGARPVPPPPPPRRFRSWGGDGGGDGGGGGGDPLAQTFFTFGIKGGCFVTKIDLFFQSKDPSLPVELQIRNVVNGYPGPRILESSVLSSSQVNISATASVATTFEFIAPVYLEEDMNYCFVLLSNSNKYNMWTSELGKPSIETKKTIFEQPHIGSLFKSENNATWTAYQTEDIKFTLYKAKFDTSVEREVVFKANVPPVLIFGEMFTVTSGSPVVNAKFNFEHGFITGDKIYITALTGATYRGITAATFNNVAGFTITKINDYELQFSVGSNATSTGTLQTSGILNAVEVDESGTGYVAPTITISAPTGGSPVQATAVANVVGGQIVSVTVTNPGAGYIEEPTYTLTDAGGSGALLSPISEAIFVVSINRPYQTMVPFIDMLEPPQTGNTNTIRTSNSAYALGQHTLHDLNIVQNIEKKGVITTSQVDTARFGGQPGTQMILRLRSDNSNVSPMIDLSFSPPRLQLHNFLVNAESVVGVTELTNSGTALSRYISKPVSLQTVSIGARVFVNASSVSTTWFDVYIRTSLSTSAEEHTEGSWVKMNCLVDRNLSANDKEYKDYEFFIEADPFDVYDIKIVLCSSNKHDYPVISNYRAIILAT